MGARLPLIASAFSVSYDMIKSGHKTLTIAWFIAFVSSRSLPITLYEVTQHLENYRRRDSKPRYDSFDIRRMLWMDGSRLDSSRRRFISIREIYEAYVIYNFYTQFSSCGCEFCSPACQTRVASHQHLAFHILATSSNG